MIFLPISAIFAVVVQHIFLNKCTVAKGKTCRESGKEGHFAASCKSNLPI